MNESIITDVIRAQRQRCGIQRNLEGSVEELVRHGARGRACQRKLHGQRPCGGGVCACCGETMGKPVSLEHRELRGLGEK